MTANKHDIGKPRASLLPFHAMNDVLAVLEFGAAKYGDHNYRTGMRFSRCFDAAIRHLWAWARGEENDMESGLPHLAHAAVNCLFILEWAKGGVGEDDMWHHKNQTAATPQKD
jgi:hypothetical protein